MRVLTAGSLLLLPLLLGACRQQQQADPRRFELRRVSDSTFEIFPAAEQLPYCLAFTTSAQGTTRQLTMTHENRSVACPSGAPVAGLRFRAPVDEGAVRVHVLFSDQKLSAASVGQQIYELVSAGKAVNPMELRLAGRVQAETQDFQPAAERASQVGAVVGVTDAGGP